LVDFGGDSNHAHRLPFPLVAQLIDHEGGDNYEEAIDENMVTDRLGYVFRSHWLGRRRARSGKSTYQTTTY
jgi:hypothetical protein